MANNMSGCFFLKHGVSIFNHLKRTRSVIVYLKEQCFFPLDKIPAEIN